MSLKVNLSFYAIIVGYGWILSTIKAEDLKVVNGTTTSIEEYPYAVSLRRAKSGAHMCGGSLLNNRWILTAAHCVVNRAPEDLNIQYGSTVISRNTTRVAQISGIYIHDDYNQIINDIALLRLNDNGPMDDDEYDVVKRGVQLPPYNATTPRRTPVVLIGWGLNATRGTIQEYLQKADLIVYDDNECSVRHLRPIERTALCAGVDEGGKGQCNGDSGGPLLSELGQVGIVSWSRKPCTIAPYPGVYTEVSAFTHWILNTIVDAELENDSSRPGTPITIGNLRISFDKQ